MKTSEDHDLTFIDHSRATNRTLGLVMILVGIGLYGCVVGGVMAAEEGVYSESERSSIFLWGALIIGGVTGLVVAMFMTSGKRVWTDVEEGLVGTELRFLGFRRRRELPLTSDGAIVHREREVSNEEHSFTVWVVEYVCEDGDVELHRLKDPIEGRGWAERFARHLDLPLAEHVEGVLAHRAPEDLDRSVTEQGLADGLRWPGRRLSERVRWSRGRSGGVEISIDPPGFGGATVLGIGLVTFSAGLGGYLLMNLPADMGIGGFVCVAAFLGFLGLLGALGVAAVHGSLIEVERWRVDRHGLGPVGDPRSRMTAEEIEQVAAGEGVLSVRGDFGSHALGCALEEGVIQDLRSVVLLALAGRAPEAC